MEVQRGITEEKSLLLKQAYEKLEERKDHYYRKLTENGSEILGIVDKNGVMKFVSSTIEKEFGYKPSEILNQSGFKYIHPTDLEKVYVGFQEVLDTPNTQLTATYRYQHKDGSWHYVENFVKNLLHDKDIEGVVINFRNINAHILNQQKISEKERYYRSLIENSSDIISIIDIEGRYQYLSPSFEKQFGHYAINFIGEDIFQYIHPEDVEDVKVLFDKVKKVPGWQLVINKLYRTLDSTGTWRYLESAAHNLIEDPIIQGIVINTRIVDEKISDQRKLANREKYYRSLIENSMDMIAVRNDNAVVTYCSPSTRTILGYEEEELIGTTGFHLIHPDDFSDAEKDWEYLMNNPNEMIRVEQRVKKKGGTWIFVEARIINLLHIESVGGVVSNFSDITQRKEAEQIQKEYEQTLEKEVARKTQQLKEQNNALEATLNRLKSTQVQLVNAEKMASLGQLTAGIAHEINNPINFVSANIFPLKTDFQDIKAILEKYQNIAASEDKFKASKEADAYAEEMDLEYLFEEMEALIDGIEEGANRTRDIVAGLRNFSRLDEDTIKMADVHSGLDATLIILKNETKENITIEQNYDTAINEIECYPGKLNQVFMNLLSNAIQAIKGKGSITITTENSEEHVRIKIKDTGVGMSDNVKKRIFEPFFTTKDVGKGTGLGLSITYGIIKDHKGKIFVNSELGKGSEFVIVLPKRLVS
ncbi:MAG: PAS domain-containing sensor histidine kinase [Chitinophagales bacterium]